MSMEEDRDALKETIDSLQKELSRLDQKIRDRRHVLGLIGNEFQKITWAPETTNNLPQIFSWTFEEDPIVAKISESLFLKEGSPPVSIPLPTGDISLSLVGGRLWLTSPDPENLLKAVRAWRLRVEDLSHVFEKLDRQRARLDLLEEFCLKLFPLREVP